MKFPWRDKTGRKCFWILTFFTRRIPSLCLFVLTFLIKNKDILEKFRNFSLSPAEISFRSSLLRHNYFKELVARDKYSFPSTTKWNEFSFSVRFLFLNTLLHIMINKDFLAYYYSFWIWTVFVTFFSYIGPCAALLNIKNLQKTVGFPEKQILTYDDQQFCVDFYSAHDQPMREIGHFQFDQWQKSYWAFVRIFRI